MMLQRQSRALDTPKSQGRPRLLPWNLVAEAAIATTVVSVFVSASPGLFDGRVAANSAAAPDAGKSQLIAIHLPVGTAKPYDARKNLKQGLSTLEREVNTVVGTLAKNLKRQ